MLEQHFATGMRCYIWFCNLGFITIRPYRRWTTDRGGVQIITDNMFEAKGIAFILLDVACLILGVYTNIDGLLCAFVDKTCVRACVCVFLRVRVCVCVCVRACVCVLFSWRLDAKGVVAAYSMACVYSNNVPEGFIVINV